jgi:hypothetical protein
MSQLNVNRVVDTSGGVLAPISSVMRNRLINGSFTIDQRNAGASVTPTATTFTLDRWVAVTQTASKYSVQQNAGSVTPPVGFTNYIGVTSLSAYSVVSTEWMALQTRVEGFNIADLDWGTANAKTVTLSFWVRSSLTGTFGGSLANNDASRSYPYSYTISAANTWEYKTITIAGDTTGTWVTNNGLGIRTTFGIGVGSNFVNTAGAWASGEYYNATGATSVVGTNGATFYITGVQLEVGTQATSFEYRQYGTELSLCYRYFSKQNFFGAGVWGGSGGSIPVLSVQWGATMRASPTAAWVSGGNAGNGNVDYTITGLNFQGNVSPNGGILGFNITGSTGTNAQGCILNNPVMTFSAEL